MKTKFAVAILSILILAVAAGSENSGQAPAVKPLVPVKVPLAWPIISSATSSIHVLPVPLIDLEGRAFGDPQGSRRVLIDGIPVEIAHVMKWTDTAISFEPPVFPFIAWYHDYACLLYTSPSPRD